MIENFEEDLFQDDEDFLRQAVQDDDYDEDEDSENEDVDFRMPKLMFDESGNPISPPPFDESGNPISPSKARRMNAQIGKVEANTQAYNESIMPNAPRFSQQIKNQVANNILTTLLTNKITINMEVEVDMASMDVLKAIKENSNISDDEFIEYIETKLDVKSLAEKILQVVLKPKDDLVE